MWRTIRKADMMMVDIPKLLTLLAFGTLVNGFSLLAPTVYVSDGGSFFQYVTNANYEITNCSAQFLVYTETITFLLDLKTTSAPIVTPDFQDATNLAQRVRSLGDGKCGFRLENATFYDPDTWTLRGSGNSDDNSAGFRVLFYASRELRSTQNVTVGLRSNINCGGQETTQAQYFCELYNPKGELVMSATRCSYGIGVTSMEDLGTWHCIVGVIQSFQALRYVVDVVDEALGNVDGWVQEFDDRVDIGCRDKRFYTSALPYCRMISPQGQEFIVRPGLAIGRYTTFNTDLQRRICSIQIEKPLLNIDIGIWRCDINNVGRPLQVGNRIVFARGMTSTSVDLRSPFTVKCVVPYSSTNCFITSPTGTRYFPQHPSRAQMGECEITLTAEEDHNGTWKCHFFVENNPVPNDVNFEVLVTNGLTCTKEVATAIGKSAEFSCNTGRTPLQYCWFTSPNNETYQLEENQNTNSARVSYVGRGLRFGDCGVKIDGVQATEIGNWSCTLILGTSGTPTTTVLKLTVPSGTSLAAALGASVGASIAVIIIFGSLVYRKWKRSGQTDEAVELNRQPSISSGESEETFTRPHLS